MKTIYQQIQALLDYGDKQGLLAKEDRVYSRNRLMALFQLNEWEEVEITDEPAPVSEILNEMLDWAAANGLLLHNTLTERDIFDTEIMNCLMPRPSEVIRAFKRNYQESPVSATNQYYQFSLASNYIRTDRVKKNRQWKSATPYGEIDITINLSKPEKDPAEIALLKNSETTAYPLCALCRENEGFKGNLQHAARATHRIIPIQLNEENWFLQYSPYVYYSEHCIVFREEHLPMKLTRDTFKRLLDFTEQFPHYFVGTNADLPIVGGSILSHDHFQGGRYEFALERAEVEETFDLPGFPQLSVGIVDWPMSVIRLNGDKENVERAADFIYKIWQYYSDSSVDVQAFSGDTPHHTVTPIARRKGDSFEMDIVLRDNRTTAEHPNGLFHPHQELHHLKKENIGLIEVMGLAVLPGRLDQELRQLSTYLVQAAPKMEWDEHILKHYDWGQQIMESHPYLNEENVDRIIEQEVGERFQLVLEHCGVFKRTEEGKFAFRKFMAHLQKNAL